MASPYTKCSKPQCAKPIAFLPTKTGKTMPVDEDSLSIQDMADIEDGKPVLYDGKRHVSHFGTCQFASQFSKKAKK